jgi:hypothetical protein
MEKERVARHEGFGAGGGRTTEGAPWSLILASPLDDNQLQNRSCKSPNDEKRRRKTARKSNRSKLLINYAHIHKYLVIAIGRWQYQAAAKLPVGRVGLEPSLPPPALWSPTGAPPPQAAGAGGRGEEGLEEEEGISSPLSVGASFATSTKHPFVCTCMII